MGPDTGRPGGPALDERVHMRNLGSRLFVLAIALVVMLFHTEVYAQFQAAFGSTGEVPTVLKWSAFVAVALLLILRRR